MFQNLVNLINNAPYDMLTPRVDELSTDLGYAEEKGTSVNNIAKAR